MPIYEYRCTCGKERELILPLNSPSPICECNKVMQRKVSVSSFRMKQTGSQMTLDTLNSNVVGGKRKDWAENMAATGLK